MAVRDTAVDLAVGVAAGFVATKVTDRVQRSLYRLTPESEKAREPRFPKGSSAMVAAQKTAELLDVEPDKDGLRALKSAIHYGLGLGWGGLYGLLRRHSQMTPIGAGTVTGASLSLIIDEALNPALGITAPSHRYPVSSHVRGFLTHIIYGLVLAAAAEGLYRLTDRTP
jgi:uncharacterized membrane protein YagU involved in acid resistance